MNPSIKIDLLNALRNKKYFLEQDLVQTFSNNIITYSEKIERMQCILKDITIVNSQIQLVDVYLKEEVAQQPVQHNGQSHVE